MKIFVTVGTTKFDELIKYIESSSFFGGHSCVLQVGPKGYSPSNFECFSYAENIREYYEWADVVITHAGAGSIYQLLDMNKRIVIVPNLKRIDKHQLDIAQFMHRNGFAHMAISPECLVGSVTEVASREIRIFTKEEFNKEEEIVDYLVNSL